MPDLPDFLRQTELSAERIRNLRQAVSRLFVGKEEIVRLMTLCTAAKEPLLLVGEPGTAKSDLVVQFCELMGVQRGGVTGASDRAPARYFEFLLTPFTEPSEVFGPVNIDAYTRNQVYSRNSVGMLQEASVAFLDEVFKANSAILNSLLTILNERKFYDGARAVAVPLTVLFGATNEVPASDDLGALFDRFTLRVECINVRTEEELRDLVRLGLRRESLRARQILGDPAAASAEGPLASLDDFAGIHRAAVGLLDQDEFLRRHTLLIEKFLRKVRAIRQDRLSRLNDRKVIKLLKLMVVQAILERRDLGTEDAELLQFIWDNPYDAEGRRRLREIARAD